MVSVKKPYRVQMRGWITVVSQLDNHIPQIQQKLDLAIKLELPVKTLWPKDRVRF